MVDHPLQWVVYAFIPLLGIGIGIFYLFQKKSKGDRKRVIGLLIGFAIAALFFYLSQQGYL